MEIPYSLWQRHIAAATEPRWGPYRQTFEGTVPFDGDSTASLEELFRIFNIDHPAGFYSHSLSIGDRVVLGEEATFECARFGWEPCEHPSLAPASVLEYMF